MTASDAISTTATTSRLARRTTPAYRPPRRRTDRLRGARHLPASACSCRTSAPGPRAGRDARVRRSEARPARSRLAPARRRRPASSIRDEPFDVRADGRPAPVRRHPRPWRAAQFRHRRHRRAPQRPRRAATARPSFGSPAARRDKLLDPGKLDHLAAGGVPAGLTPLETLAKEAAEECGLDADLIVAARRGRHSSATPCNAPKASAATCCTLLRHFSSFPSLGSPVAHDDEVEAFELWPLRPCLRRPSATPTHFKFNVNLVLIDLFRRQAVSSPTPAANSAGAWRDNPHDPLP